MHWGDKIVKNLKSHDDFCEKVDRALNECLGELEDLKLAVHYEFMSLYPPLWKISLNNREVEMKGTEVQENLKQFDENHNFVGYGTNVKNAVQTFLINNFNKTF